jgi:hypothetical protein
MLALRTRSWSALLRISLSAAALCGVAAAQTSTTKNRVDDRAPDAVDNSRVDKLLSGMTLAEKIAVIHGEKDPPEESQGQAGYMAGDPKLGIPWLRLADGPPGLLTRHPSTAPTGTMGLGRLSA